MNKNPTAYPEVNRLLQELYEQAEAILGGSLIGMYLDGSLTSGDFDEDSDIDFVTVSSVEITAGVYSALQDMHDHLAALDSVWAIQLEGSYISQHALRRYDPTHNTLYPNIERGEGERLKMASHGQAWDIHRYVLRERGIPLAGPAAETLIDPVLPDQLRRASLSTLPEWAGHILSEPAQIEPRGYQSYTVLTLCRILYTLQLGAVASKPTAAGWAKRTLPEHWAPLIERAWEGRHNSNMKATPEDIRGTLEFIRYTLEHSRRFQQPTDC
jgi:Aminoglycoside adenylyltransferase, C-terminal domain